METVLTRDQENAKNLIIEWFFNTDDRVFVLSGYAGTGKTFLIDYIVREVLHLRAGEDAMFISPTGKAAANLVKNGTAAWGKRLNGNFRLKTGKWTLPCDWEIRRFLCVLCKNKSKKFF